ncbi:MAG: NTP transferase domain-containing protein, partial [Caldilineaceae bacterium]|nr:NTP transferase domain-containing protein [Caldilineaceae bacterium]
MNVLILAAGSPAHEQPETTQEAWLLMSLGDRKLIDYVMDLAREVATPDEIFVVVDAADGEVARHLGATVRYVVQESAQGTGHAVHQAAAALADVTGPLLILYGDTPLIRDSSIRGLITRHALKGAALTLLSARTALPLPYGQVTRDRSGRIVAVKDEAGDAGSPANARVALRELNIGAYVADPARLWPALAELARSRRANLHLTDVVAVLVRQNKVVEAYRALDADEVRGVNTSDDLTQAEVTLQKRQLRPRRNQERNLIRFGTGGWRALIGEGFTLDNVRRLCQALANDILRNGREQAGVLIGYDRRFLGEEAATAAAEIFAANNIPVDLLAEAVPTPLVTYATAARTYAYGLIFTASHNPAQWNGLKVFASDGSLPMDDQTYRIAAEANALTPGQVVKVELETARNAGLVQTADYTNQYVDAVEKLIDLQAIRRAGLRVAIDPMYGVGQVTLEIILTEARCRLTTIHSRHDPLFGGRSPAPDHGELNLLINTVCEGGYDLGLAMDGDADRIAIIDDQGTFITTNQLLLLLYYYLHAVRRERGGVTRNLA